MRFFRKAFTAFRSIRSDATVGKRLRPNALALGPMIAPLAAFAD